ncbi:MAG: hypothetical protein P4M14_02035 [Gammaproteobacteria bacterium]|nr:hypothetical protein [Gammaproteobacteria bacterium]
MMVSDTTMLKVIDKSQADIDAATDAIKASDIPAATKDFAISLTFLKFRKKYY